MESGTNWPSSSNLSFMRSCLGHSDPQISATSSTSSTPKFTVSSFLFFLIFIFLILNRCEIGCVVVSTFVFWSVSIRNLISNIKL